MTGHVTIVCRGCAAEFQGRYNRTKCDSCKAKARARAMQRFKDENPDYWKQWWERQPKTSRYAQSLVREYGITESDVDRMRAAQGGKCAICDRVEGDWNSNGGKLVVDHCHSTGRVRGLLCPYCNRALGQFFDSVPALKKAVWYLEREIARIENG